MQFRIFGIPVHVQAGFWLTGVFLSYRELLGPQKYLALVWLACVFVSILIHELGHAFVMIRYGLSPEITLHMLGGAAGSPGLPRLTRPQRIFVSFAGPLAGFVLGGVVYGILNAFPQLTTVSGPEASAAEVSLVVGLQQLFWINIWWGVVNLVPVLPLDGGHILEDLLGPKRLRTTAIVALIAGSAVVLYAVSIQWWWLAFIFGLATAQSFQRFRAAAAPAQRSSAPPREREESIDPSVAARLAEARAALDDERFDEAGTIAELVLSSNPPKSARVAALSVIVWAHLLEGRASEAARVLGALRREGEPDAALVAAILMAQDELGDARRLLEAARATGDDRKEIVGPLIQILIRQGEVARAAATALDIVETLSEEDARQMATIAFEHQAYPWAARLQEALFERTAAPEDAYDAVRSKALEGDLPGALTMLRRAVAAGYSDSARAWSDKALEALRSSAEQADELEALLPRP